jgi:hypothetical protein
VLNGVECCLQVCPLTGLLRVPAFGFERQLFGTEVRDVDVS